MHGTIKDNILMPLDAIGYNWEPSLEPFKNEFQVHNQVRLAQFLLGQLVFARDAQQIGAPHVLAPKRSLLMTSIGLQNGGIIDTTEAAVFKELGRRFRYQEAG